LKAVALETIRKGVASASELSGTVGTPFFLSKLTRGGIGVAEEEEEEELN
jgi:hypothetical protein